MTRMDPAYAQLEDFCRTDARRCVACGNCLYVCPVFKQLTDDAFSARGRNQSIKDSESGAADPAALSRCLLCGRCSAICPQGVQHDKVVLASRAYEFARRGCSLPETLVKWLLTHPAAFRRALRLAARLQVVLPRSVRAGDSSESPITRYLPTLFLSGGAPRRVPSIAAHFMSDGLPVLSASAVTGKNAVRVVYFAGCATEYIYPGAGTRMIAALNALGADVVSPKDLLCCGIPILAGGDAGTARDVARRNLAILMGAKADYVVTGCATCGSTLRDVWPTLFDSGEKRDALALAEQVKDPAELIRMLGGYKFPPFRSRLPANSRVTYHYPCHSLRYPDTSGYAVDLLKQVFGPDYVELENTGCCGCGGSFNLHHYALSRRIGQDKIESIRRTGADVVVTSCPGCMIQITDGLHRCGLRQKVVHLMEAIEPE